jgi:hypothetical protein
MGTAFRRVLFAGITAAIKDAAANSTRDRVGRVNVCGQIASKFVKQASLAARCKFIMELTAGLRYQ